MNRNSIRWQLPASYAVIALLAALTLGSMMLLVLRNYYANQEREYLEGNALTLRPVIEQILQSDLPESSLQEQIKSLAFLSQTQIHLLDMNGNTIADSGVPVSRKVVAVQGGAPMAGNVMFSAPVNPPIERGPILLYKSAESHPLPEVIPFGKQTNPAKSADIILSVNASPYGYGFVAKADFDAARRSSQVVGVPLMAFNGKPLGELQFSNGPSYGADIINSVTGAWLLASIFAIGIAALAGWFMSKRVTQPVLALESATQQMEKGDLGVRVDLQKERQQEFLSLASSFNSMAAQVEQTVSTLREFVADAAHELHTPLTALQANIELARNETLAPPGTVRQDRCGASAGENASARSRYLARAHEQSQRLEGLVQSLLDLSRIEAADAKAKATFATVDMAGLAREVGEQFASRAEQADRSFTMNVPEEIIHVDGNETQLKQIMINLLENALKFTPGDGWISLDVERSSDQVKLTVSDSGIGIPSEDLPHLFERFHRGRNASEYPGNGLGLAIVKAIVNAHNGEVAVQSTPRQGTTVSVSLPIE